MHQGPAYHTRLVRLVINIHFVNEYRVIEHVNSRSFQNSPQLIPVPCNVNPVNLIVVSVIYLMTSVSLTVWRR
jgi:hypothetical protein